MKMYEVKFNDYGKVYIYKSNLDLHKDFFYRIVADGRTEYSSPIKVVEIWNDYAVGVKAHMLLGDWKNDIEIREITSAEIVKRGKKKKDSGIKQVYFNEEKGTTVVCWKDGTKTKVRCCDGDVFDKEKGLAMCYVKRTFDNQGYYNDFFKQWCE